jgi:Tfp pilus assembly protein PilO
MTRNTKILVAVVALVAVAGAYWFLLLAPKRDEIAKVDADIATKQTEVEQARQQLATYEAARKSYKRNYATLARLGKAVPADDDVRSLLVQIDDAAERSGVDFGKIEIGGSAAAATSASDASATTETEGESQLAPPPGTVPFGSDGFAAMPFSFTFTGSFFDLSTFLARLERFVSVQNDRIGANGRLLRLESLQLQPASSGFPQIQAEIAAATYIVPSNDDLPAAAPDGSAGTTPDATESAVKPPDVPTATATGGAP